MGLASSQARLLSLTSRQHSVEGEAQRIMANKMRLANDSDRVYQKYLNALDETLIKTRQTNASGQNTWIDASVNNLLRCYAAEDTCGTIFYVQNMKDGTIYLPLELGEAYDNSSDEFEFASKFGVTYTESDNYRDLRIELEKAFEAGWNTMPENSSEHKAYLEIKANYDKHYPSDELIPNNVVKSKYYQEIYKAVKAAGGWTEISETNAKSASWVTNMVKSTQVILAVWDEENSMLSKTADSLHYNLREISNENKIEVAGQEYEEELATINSKDAKYDTRLQKLESEREAIELEIKSLKDVANQNINATFKVFT